MSSPAKRVVSRAMSKGLADEPEASSESVEELVDEGQEFEAEVVDGVENAPLADEGERIIHERPETPNENVPDEEEPGEKQVKQLPLVGPIGAGRRRLLP